MSNIAHYHINYTDDDYDFVYEMKKNSYKDYVEINYGEWNEQVQKEMFIEFINTYKKYIKIIMVDGEKIGFYHTQPINEKLYEFGNICIKKKYQGKKIGTSILISEIQKHNNQDITLRVFKQNPARKLYERLGFKIHEETAHHYKMILKAKEK